MRKDHPLLVGIEGVTPYPMTDTAEMYAQQPPAMQIDAFLPVGGVMGMTSYPGVGKTWLQLEVARAVATGTKFLGQYAAQQGGVLFVGSDSSLYDYARQWTRLTRERPDSYDAVRFLIQSDFMFEDRDSIRRLIATHRSFQWGELEWDDDEKDMVQPSGFHVIIFDTLSRLTRANQNDNTEMEEVFRNIRWIAEATNAALILSHHNSKRSEFNDGTDWRGAMSQIGALDSWVQLVNHRRDAHLIGVQYKKFRGIKPDDFSYRMNVSEIEHASLVMSSEPVTMEQKLQHDPVAEKLTEYIEKHPGLRANELRDQLWPSFKDLAEWHSDQKKFSKAVNNRLNKLTEKSVLLRSENEKGNTVYGPAKDQTST